MKTGFRHIIQLVSAALCNGYITGFREKTIFRGKSKMACVPVLNCYSCPGAAGACPIGSLQAVLGDSNYRNTDIIWGTSWKNCMCISVSVWNDTGVII